MGQRSRTKIKFAIFVLVLVAIILVVKFTGALDNFSASSVRSFLDGMGAWAPVAFIAIYAVAVAVGIPGTIFTIVGGLVFGKWFGTLFNVIGASIGACAAFWIARFFARDLLMEKFAGQKWFDRFNKGLEKDGVYYMLFVRLVPLFPFNGLNFGAGITKLGFRDYLIGTSIGIIPGAFVFTNAAAELGESAAAGFKLTGGVITAFALLGLFALVPILIKRRIESRAEK